MLHSTVYDLSSNVVMYPLQLVIKPENWRWFNKRKAAPAFQRFSEKVFKRDHFTCQYCGFQAQAYQEIVNVDYNYTNNKLSNLVTACCFCAQCHFLERVGSSEYGGGVLIYLPEISQNDLNSICHVLFHAIYHGTAYAETAQSLYRALRLRSQPIEQQFGGGNQEPANFSRYFIEAGLLAKPSVANRLLANIRLLPSRTKFKNQIAAWAEASSLSVEQAGHLSYDT